MMLGGNSNNDIRTCDKENNLHEFIIFKKEEFKKGEIQKRREKHDTQLTNLNRP